MAAHTVSSMVTSSPLMAMNPTITEHDFRFPRRPYVAGTAPRPARGAAPAQRAPTAPSAAVPDFKLDLDTTYGAAQVKLSRIEVFDSLRDGAAGAGQSPEEMRQQDPLATQVWRFFTKTKQSLPNQERMENLTWRMMHMNLRKKQLEQRARCVLQYALG